ncbi:MAG: hypothetical protein GIKADHBN_00801 [Phycisphaerales bacterium]|nr:hypothetical protein [Phycisphaerales bacterium]
MKRYVLPAIAAGLCAGSALGQCDTSFTVDLQSAYRATKPATNVEVQNQANAWTFHVNSTSGALLTGMLMSGNVYAWGTVGQPYSVPLAGPVASPDPGLNELYFYDRAISVDGIMLHPGYSGFNLAGVFTSAAPVTLTGISVQGEVLGDISNGISVGVQAYRTSTASYATVVSPTVIPFTSSGHTTLGPVGGVLPLTLSGPGEPLVMTITNNGAPFEDWLNGQVTLTMTGGPLIWAQPRSSGACQGTPTVLQVKAGASGSPTYQWVKQVVVNGSTEYHALSDGPTDWGSTISGSATDTLTITHASPLDGGSYNVYVGSTCTSLPTLLSSTAIITVCVADYDCSGFVDTDDFTAFVLDFEAGVDEADVDGTGFVDTDDFTFYVLAFEAGC